MSHPDEGLIHAWLDGELDAAESARIEALVQSDPAWAAAVAEARGFIAASSRIVSALDDVPANVIPAAPVGARPVVPRQPESPKVIPLASRQRGTPWWALRAAAVLVVVAGTVVVMQKGTPEVVPDLAKSSADLTDSGAAPLASAATADASTTAGTSIVAVPAPAPAPPLRNDVSVRRETTDEADAKRQLAAEGKVKDAKETENAKLSAAGVTALRAPTAAPAAPQPAAAAAAAMSAAGASGGAGAAGGAAVAEATRLAPSVTAGSAPMAERRALGFAVGAADQAAQAEQCFRESAGTDARTLGAIHRVRVGADSTARRIDDGVRARTRGAELLTRLATTSMRVRADTLIIVGADGTTVRALRVSCPSP